MIRDPIVIVECDKCGDEEEHHLTRTGRGWDDRGMEDGLRKAGWTVEDGGNITYCPDCSQTKGT